MNDNSTYPAPSRGAALECGDLVDRTECAMAVGICVPTAFTRLAYEMTIYHPDYMWWMDSWGMTEWLLGNLARAIRVWKPKAGPTMVLWQTS